MVKVGDVGEGLTSFSDIVSSSSEQIASGSPVTGVGVGYREVSSSEEIRQFFRVNLVVFDFPAVDGFEIQSVSQHKGNLLGLTEITQPIPVEGGFTRHDQIVGKGLDV